MLVTVEDGRAVRVQGDPDHPMTRGFLCSKVNRYPERTYHAGRLLHPLRRVGPKGSEEFERVSWSDALDLVADGLQRSIDRHGPESVLPYSYSGTLGLIQGNSMDYRFFHALGASKLDRTICATAGAEALNATYGTRMGTDPESIPEARMILLWGTNTLTSNPHLWPFVRKARDSGASVICIDPIRTRTAEASDQHIALRPGTDAALALAIMHVLFRDGLEDRAYLEEMSVGWERLRDRTLAEYSPARVAGICRIEEATIEELGARYGRIRPSFIRLNYGLQRHAGGGAAVRAISLLPAVTGDWNHAGGGMQLSSAATFPVRSEALERPDLSPPGTRTINMSTIGHDLLERTDPPIGAIVVYNSNPVAVAPDQSLVRRGFSRDDLFVVVLEHFMTDTAKYADVVLPATTQLEHEDIHKSYGHLYLVYNHASIEPCGEALPNTEIFRQIAARMGLEDPALGESDAEMMESALDWSHPAMQGITLARLRDEGSVRLNLPVPHLPFEQGSTLPTPSGKIEIESSMMTSLGLDPIPGWIPPLESPERSPDLASRYPLTLISPPHHTFMNSTFANVEPLRRKAGEPTLDISHEDASARGIEDGVMVLVRNDRGAFFARAAVSARVPPGTVSAPSIWWLEDTPTNANANATTSQALTDIGAAATFYDNLVEVEPRKEPGT